MPSFWHYVLQTMVENETHNEGNNVQNPQNVTYANNYVYSTNVCIFPRVQTMAVAGAVAGEVLTHQFV